MLALTCFALLELNFAKDASSVQNNQKRQPLMDDSTTCGIYFARSTIPGAGMGLFAGRHYKTNETVTHGDIVIPLVDYMAHNSDIAADEIIIQSYYWLPHLIPGMPEEAVGSFAFAPGIGAAINCYFPLVNTMGYDAETQMSNAGYHRRKDPGVGAFTPYHGRYGYATKDIQAGEELFTDYGKNYFIYQEETFGKIPLYDDYPQADALLRNYSKLRNDLIAGMTGSKRNTKSSIDYVHHSLHKDWYGLLVKLKSLWPSRTLNALPDDVALVDHIAEIGTSMMHHNRSIRSIQWLEQNGYCADHLKPGLSSIPQAGRGAFAQRRIAKGAIVGPAPLIHLHAQILDMYPTQYAGPKGDNLEADLKAPPVHRQILMNYCFGHPLTYVVLCPYGMLTSLINHAPTPKQVNAKVVWNHELTNQDWLKQPVEEWIWDKHVNLFFNFVATRDIEAGEEVLIDYGKDWSAAWKHHVETWNPPPGAELYRPAFELNEDDNLIFRTVLEGGYTTKHLELYLHEVFRSFNRRPVYEEELHITRIIHRVAQPNGEMRYVAETTSRETDEEEEICTEDFFEVLWDLPREAFEFEDAPYTRDTQQPWSFRHPLGIPDDILPNAWKTELKQKL